MSPTSKASPTDVSATAIDGIQRLVHGRRGSVFATLLVGIASGCWIAYILVYPVSSLPLNKYTLAGTFVLGFYADYYAESMLDRLLTVFGASMVAFGVGFVGYAFPALVGWYSDPLVQRAIYLSGLRETFLFTLLGMTLLIVGTFGSYVLRNTYEEVTR
ncbi:hypothetical protein Halar_3341 [halophilic archaeon DL31]|jgi:hypothetical protein|nr:hypothetical protein Halar_3341 [halophilic archaeon DL31]